MPATPFRLSLTRWNEDGKISLVVLKTRGMAARLDKLLLVLCDFVVKEGVVVS